MGRSSKQQLVVQGLALPSGPAAAAVAARRAAVARRAPDNGATALDGLDDLGRRVASQRKARGGRVNLHCAPQRLLCALRHATHRVTEARACVWRGVCVWGGGGGGGGPPPPPPPPRAQPPSLQAGAGGRASSCGGHAPVSLVQDHNLLAPRRQRDLLLRKQLDLVAHNVNTAVVRSVQLQHRLAKSRAQQLVRQAEDAGGFPRARGALRRRAAADARGGG